MEKSGRLELGENILRTL